ncbi:MAG: hypothetical protein H7222_10020 [Methylotenera sp.]|nr:hypothetical protein [Oligoflexia bacterium]
MNRSTLPLLFAVTAAMTAATGALSGCQRSPAYKQDQNYYKSEGTSYYDNANKTGTKKVESMGQPKKRLIVFNFWNDTPVKSDGLGIFAADELRRGLFQSQRIIVPADVKTALATEDFINGDKVKVAQLIREGRRMGVSVLVIGRISKITFRQRGDDVGLFRQKQSLAAVDVELKLFDVAGGREILATGKSGESSSNSMVALEDTNLESPQYRAELTKLALREAVGKVIPDVLRSVEKMTWQGHIAKVSGAKIYVNAGKTSGLVGGDILKVLSPGDDIYDPATGAYLGRSQGQLKGTLEVLDFIGTDGAVTEVHTGGNFQEGDVVQLY